jgi:catalase
MWVNAAGEKFEVKYHFKINQDVEFFTQDEADQMAAMDTDYHTATCMRQSSAGTSPAGR